MRSKNEYALLWANGMKFGEIFDLMKSEIELDVSLQQARDGDTTPALTAVEEVQDMTATIKAMKLRVKKLTDESPR